MFARTAVGFERPQLPFAPRRVFDPLGKSAKNPFTELMFGV